MPMASDAQLIHSFPRIVAQAWAEVLRARGNEAQHGALVDVVKAVVELTCDITEAEYRDHRLANAPIDEVERMLQGQTDARNLTLGLRLQRALTCWRHLGEASRLACIPMGATGSRPHAGRFVATWEAVKLTLSDLHGADAQRACRFSLLPRLLQEKKAQSALTPFLEALVNCRNAHAHREGFSLSGNQAEVPLGFGPAYYDAVTPVLRAALEELLAELAPAVAPLELHRIASTSETRASGQFVHTVAERGLAESASELPVSDVPLLPDTRWLAQNGLPVLQLPTERLRPLAVPGVSSAETASKTPSQITVAVADGRQERGPPFTVPFRSKAGAHVGRDGALVHLHALLTERGRTLVGQAASIHGMGGVGKTQLAVEYAHTYRDAYPDGVLWFEALRDREGQLAEFAVQGLGHRSDDKPDNLVRAARLWLEAHGRCLLILDNAELGTDLDAWLPRQTSPTLLVTSRHVLPSAIPLLSLEDLPLADAERMLRLVAGLDGANPRCRAEDVTALCRELQCYPLALELAGSYIRVHPVVRIEDYLDQVRKRGVVAPGQDERGALPATRHVASVRATLALDREALADQPHVLQIIETMSVWRARSMSLGLLTAMVALPNEADARAQASQAIALGLLGTEPGSTRVHVHPFLQEVVRAGIGGPRAERLRVTMAAGAAGWLDSRRDAAYTSEISEEIEGLQTLARESRDAEDIASWPTLFREIGRYRVHGGRYQEAVEVWLDTAHRALGGVGRDLERAITAAPLTRALLGRARLADARVVIEEALAAMAGASSEVVPRDHVDALRAGAWVARDLAHYSVMEQRSRASLELAERTLGPEDRDTLGALQDLGVVLHVIGKIAEARAVDARALEVRRRVLGEDHRDTATAYLNLGASLHSLGALTAARANKERALDITRRILGEAHPSTGRAYSSLASTLSATGDRVVAQAHGERGLAILRRALGDHPDTAIAHGILGATLYETGDLTGARSQEESGLAMRRRLLGEDHPEIATALAHLAMTQLGQQDYAGAVQNLRRAMDIAKKRVPRADLLHSTIKKNLGEAVAALNRSRPGMRQQSTAGGTQNTSRRGKKRD